MTRKCRHEQADKESSNRLLQLSSCTPQQRKCSREIELLNEVCCTHMGKFGQRLGFQDTDFRKRSC